MSANSKTETPPAATGPPATVPTAGLPRRSPQESRGRRYPDPTPQRDRVRDDRWDEVRRDAVGEILDVWLAGLGLDCLDDLLERRVRTDLRRLNGRDTVLVNGGPDDLVALTFLSTGTDSPVTIDSSAALCPSMTTPSVRICSPGRTFMRSPAVTSSSGTSRFDTVLVDEGCTSRPPFRGVSEGRLPARFRAGFEIVAERDEREDQRGSVEVQTPRSIRQVPRLSRNTQWTNPVR